MTDEQRIADLLDGEWHDEKPHHAGLSWPLVERMQLMKLPPINRIRLLKAPARADEQNKPVRSREEQIASLNRHMRWDAKGKAESFIAEAEARGAAEQRRKDAEGQELVGYVNPKEIAWIDKGKGPKFIGTVSKEKTADKTSPLYTHPANVAALEDRVRELEEENAKLKTAQFYGCDEAEGGSEDISSFFDDHEPGTILEIDGYRCVNTKWVLWDGNSPHVFDTEDEAAAALTREGGV